MHEFFVKTITDAIDEDLIMQLKYRSLVPLIAVIFGRLKEQGYESVHILFAIEEYLHECGSLEDKDFVNRELLEKLK